MKMSSLWLPGDGGTNRIKNEAAVAAVILTSFINISLSPASSKGHHQLKVNSSDPELLCLADATRHHLPLRLLLSLSPLLLLLRLLLPSYFFLPRPRD